MLVLRVPCANIDGRISYRAAGASLNKPPRGSSSAQKAKPTDAAACDALLSRQVDFGISPAPVAIAALQMAARELHSGAEKEFVPDLLKPAYRLASISVSGLADRIANRATDSSTPDVSARRH